MPTINQLVKKKRVKPRSKEKTVALGRGLNVLKNNKEMIIQP